MSGKKVVFPVQNVFTHQTFRPGSEKSRGRALGLAAGPLLHGYGRS